MHLRRDVRESFKLIVVNFQETFQEGYSELEWVSWEYEILFYLKM